MSQIVSPTAPQYHRQQRSRSEPQSATLEPEDQPPAPSVVVVAPDENEIEGSRRRSSSSLAAAAPSSSSPPSPSSWSPSSAIQPPPSKRTRLQQQQMHQRENAPQYHEGEAEEEVDDDANYFVNTTGRRRRQRPVSTPRHHLHPHQHLEQPQHHHDRQPVNQQQLAAHLHEHHHHHSHHHVTLGDSNVRFLSRHPSNDNNSDGAVSQSATPLPGGTLADVPAGSGTGSSATPRRVAASNTGAGVVGKGSSLFVSPLTEPETYLALQQALNSSGTVKAEEVQQLSGASTTGQGQYEHQDHPQQQQALSRSGDWNKIFDARQSSPGRDRHHNVFSTSSPPTSLPPAAAFVGHPIVVQRHAPPALSLNVVRRLGHMSKWTFTAVGNLVERAIDSDNRASNVYITTAEDEAHDNMDETDIAKDSNNSTSSSSSDVVPCSSDPANSVIVNQAPDGCSIDRQNNKSGHQTPPPADSSHIAISSPIQDTAGTSGTTSNTGTTISTGIVSAGSGSNMNAVSSSGITSISAAVKLFSFPFSSAPSPSCSSSTPQSQCLSSSAARMRDVVRFTIEDDGEGLDTVDAQRVLKDLNSDGTGHRADSIALNVAIARLAAGALLITRTNSSLTICMLSQKLLEHLGSSTLTTPLCAWDLVTGKRRHCGYATPTDTFHAQRLMMRYSPFSDPQQMATIVQRGGQSAINGSCHSSSSSPSPAKTGSKILLWDLQRNLSHLAKEEDTGIILLHEAPPAVASRLLSSSTPSPSAHLHDPPRSDINDGDPVNGEVAKFGAAPSAGPTSAQRGLPASFPLWKCARYSIDYCLPTYVFWSQLHVKAALYVNGTRLAPPATSLPSKKLGGDTSADSSMKSATADASGPYHNNGEASLKVASDNDNDDGTKAVVVLLAKESNDDDDDEGHKLGSGEATNNEGGAHVGENEATHRERNEGGSSSDLPVRRDITENCGDHGAGSTRSKDHNESGAYDCSLYRYLCGKLKRSAVLPFLQNARESTYGVYGLVGFLNGHARDAADASLSAVEEGTQQLSSTAQHSPTELPSKWIANGDDDEAVCEAGVLLYYKGRLIRRLDDGKFPQRPEYVEASLMRRKEWNATRPSLLKTGNGLLPRDLPPLSAFESPAVSGKTWRSQLTAVINVPDWLIPDSANEGFVHEGSREWFRFVDLVDRTLKEYLSVCDDEGTLSAWLEQRRTAFDAFMSMKTQKQEQQPVV